MLAGKNQYTNLATTEGKGLMKMRKYILFALTVLIVSSMLAACSSSDESADQKDASAKDGEKKQVFNLISNDTIPTMDSSMATDGYAFQFLGTTMEGLYRLGEDGKPVEGIAKKHSVSEDGLTWTFELREDATWTNGDPVTAHDFVYAWRRAVDPETGSEYGPYMMGSVIKNAAKISNGEAELDELGVKAEGDYQLVVELENPTPYFESLTTFGTFYPLNEKFVEEQGDKYATSADTMIFNGPFVMKDWASTSSSWEVEKNPDYWDADAVQLEKMTFDVIKDPQTALDLYQKGEVDRVDLSSDFVDQYATDENFVNTPEFGMRYFKFNMKTNEHLKNKNIRAAIGRAFDKQSLVDEILNDGSLAATGIVPQEFAKHPETGEDFREVNGDLMAYDVEEAKKYWEKGLKEEGIDSLELVFLAGDSEEGKTLSEYLANQLESNLEGLSVELKQVPMKQRIQADNNLEYDLQLSSWGPDYLDPNTFLNIFLEDTGGYYNEEFNKLVEKANTELALKPVERFNTFLEAEKILFDDAAIGPVYQTGRAQLISPKMADVIAVPFGPEYEYKWAHVE